MKEKNTTSAAPSEWPGALGAYKLSRNAIRYNLGTILMLSLMLIGSSIVLGILLEILFGRQFADTFGQFISFGLSTYFSVAITYAYLSSVQHKKIDLKAAFSFTPKIFGQMFLLNLLTAAAVVGGLILLIVPGIIIGLRLSLAPYYLVDKNLSALEAFKASWNSTKDHMGKLWGILGAGLLMLLPILTVIGILASVYLLFMYSAVFAILYFHLTKTNNKQPKVPKPINPWSESSLK